MTARTDVQLFEESGTWLKPDGAVTVDLIAKGGDGGIADGPDGGEGGGATYAGFRAPPLATATVPDASTMGALSVISYAAAAMPGTVEVTVGKGGRPGGRDGYALFVTHLEGP